MIVEVVAAPQSTPISDTRVCHSLNAETSAKTQETAKMISDLALKDPSIEDTKQADENLKHQEAKQAEGDELQVRLSRSLQTSGSQG